MRPAAASGTRLLWRAPGQLEDLLEQSLAGAQGSQVVICLRHHDQLDIVVALELFAVGAEVKVQMLQPANRLP